MTDIAVTLTQNGQLVNGVADTPLIDVRRLDTGAFVVTDDPMTDTGNNGLYTYNFTPDAGLSYHFLIDADPNQTNQVDVRFNDGSFDNEITDMWNDQGLNPSVNRTITENAEGTDYDSAVASPTPVNKSITTTGQVTTVDRL